MQPSDKQLQVVSAACLAHCGGFRPEDALLHISLPGFRALEQNQDRRAGRHFKNLGG